MKASLKYLLLFFAFAATTWAQVATGVPPFASVSSGTFDTVNLGNLNVHFAIPVVNKAGRGGFNFTYDLSYDSSVWTPVTTNGITQWQPAPNWGWKGDTEVSTGYISYDEWTTTQNSCTWDYQGHFVYHDPFGAPHSFSGAAYWRFSPVKTCTGLTYNLPATQAADRSGYVITCSYGGPSCTVTGPNGKTVNPPLAPTGAGTAKDSNGNEITVNSSGQFFDTLSSTTPVLTVSGAGTPSSPQTFAYSAPNGSQNVTVNYKQYTVETNFGAKTGTGATIQEYGRTSVPLVDNIAFPDGTKYQFTYEPTPSSGPLGTCAPLSGTYANYCVTGRIAQVTLNTGGTIAYSYNGGYLGIESDGSAAGLQRTVNPGGTWNYTRQDISGNHWQTTIADPSSPSNTTIIDFQEDGNISPYTYNFYETQRKVYQGSGPLLATTITCYNGNNVSNPSNCPSTGVSSPVSEITAFQYLPDSSGAESETDTQYNGTGFVTQVLQYDYGTSGVGSLLQKTVRTPASLTGITNLPAQVTVYDGSNNILAQTKYFYDQSPLQPTSVQQHVTPSGSRGNLTTVQSYVNGSSYLTSTYAYNDTGTVYQATDPSGAQTAYTYGACQGAFPTSVALSASGLTTLSTTNTWDCNGGVITQSRDPNLQATNYKYTDGSSSDQYSWRLKETDSPDGGVQTSVLATSSNPSTPWTITNSEKVDSAQTTSTESSLDGLGRIYQTLNTSVSPSIEVDTHYNALGQVDWSTNPYISQSDPTYGKTYYDYDALGRQTIITNPDGTTRTASYGAATVTYSDEGWNFSGNRIQRAVQYDGIGRIKSVCEITAGISWNGDSGIGGCSATLGGTGFTTSYIYDYDAAHSIQRTTVNQGSMSSRVYEYDWLGRLTSETNPEMTATGGTTGTTTYSYSSAGDLYQRTRPKQNQSSASTTVITTYTYDAYHRLTGVTYNDSTPSLAYQYDASSEWGITLTNPLGRLTWQALNGSAGTVFSYDAMGRTTSRLQCTPSTCGSTYYAVNYGYDYAGDVTSTTNGISNITFSYNYDAAQHLTQVTSNLNDAYHPGTLASSLTYNPLGELVSGSYGNGYTLSRNYDNRGRLLQKWDHTSTTTAYSAYGPATNNFMVYYPDGNLAEAGDYVNGAWTYQYDDLNRLVLASGPGAALNLLEYSQQIGQSPWTAENGASVTENDSSTPDPNNGTTASRLTANGSYSDVYQIVTSDTVAPGRTYTFSVWLKAATPTQVSIGIDRCCGPDQENMAITVGTTWQRYTVTHDGTWTTSSEPVIAGFGVYGSGNYVWAWGAQLERGTTENAYVATNSSQQTSGYTYDYDRYGNRWHQNLAGTASPNYSFDANNHIQGSGVTYDAMGNITNDGLGHTYQYDAEERLISVDNGTTASYQYDADGNRVKTTINGTGLEFIYDLSHHHLATVFSAGLGWDAGEIYAGNWHLATYANSDTYFIHSDWLGTVRVRTDHAGNVTNNFTSMPFGNCLSASGGCPGWFSSAPLTSQFTDQDRDSETGLDHFLFRQYSSIQGRWMTPDPAGLAAVDPANPQTWNRYAYVMNSPTAYVDLFGLQEGPPPPTPPCVPQYDKPGEADNVECLQPISQQPCLAGIYCNYTPPPHQTPGGGGLPPLDMAAIRKQLYQCAAETANTLSLASFTGTQDSTGGSLLLGNDASTISTLLYGSSNEPANTPPVASDRFLAALSLSLSNPASVDFLKFATEALAAAPNPVSPTLFVIKENGAGTAYAAAAGKVPIGEGLGGLVLKGVGKFFTLKSIWDGVAYTGSLFYCAGF